MRAVFSVHPEPFQLIAGKGSGINSWNDLKGKVEMEVNTASEFTQNMANGFLSSKPWVATSKLIQLKFLHTVLNMKPKKRNEFLTDMVFLAAKKGKRFGPFGKLY